MAWCKTCRGVHVEDACPGRWCKRCKCNHAKSDPCQIARCKTCLGYHRGGECLTVNTYRPPPFFATLDSPVLDSSDENELVAALSDKITVAHAAVVLSHIEIVINKLLSADIPVECLPKRACNKLESIRDTILRMNEALARLAKEERAQAVGGVVPKLSEEDPTRLELIEVIVKMNTDLRKVLYEIRHAIEIAIRDCNANAMRKQLKRGRVCVIALLRSMSPWPEVFVPLPSSPRAILSYECECGLAVHEGETVEWCGCQSVWHTSCLREFHYRTDSVWCPGCSGGLMWSDPVGFEIRFDSDVPNVSIKESLDAALNACQDEIINEESGDEDDDDDDDKEGDDENEDEKEEEDDSDY